MYGKKCPQSLPYTYISVIITLFLYSRRKYTHTPRIYCNSTLLFVAWGSHFLLPSFLCASSVVCIKRVWLTLNVLNNVNNSSISFTKQNKQNSIKNSQIFVFSFWHFIFVYHVIHKNVCMHVLREETLICKNLSKFNCICHLFAIFILCLKRLL